jgi:L-asparaginase
MVARSCRKFAFIFQFHVAPWKPGEEKESVHFNAFHSENYPHLAMAGVNIEYNTPFIRPYVPESRLKVYEEMDTNVVVLPLFPGINHQIISAILGIPGLKGLVLESYGSGNAPTETWFLNALESAIDRGSGYFQRLPSATAGG